MPGVWGRTPVLLGSEDQAICRVRGRGVRGRLLGLELLHQPGQLADVVVLLAHHRAAVHREVRQQRPQRGLRGEALADVLQAAVEGLGDGADAVIVEAVEDHEHALAVHRQEAAVQQHVPPPADGGHGLEAEHGEGAVDQVAAPGAGLVGLEVDEEVAGARDLL